MKRLIFSISVFLIFASSISAQPRSAADAKTPTIAEKVAGMQKFPGYFPFSVGASLDARLVVWQFGDGSAHGRNYSGPRQLRLSARPPGFPDRRRTAGALRKREVGNGEDHGAGCDRALASACGA